jgi:hypothetical protein
VHLLFDSQINFIRKYKVINLIVLELNRGQPRDNMDGPWPSHIPYERGRKHQRKHQDRERKPDATSVGAQDERAEGEGRPKKKEESDTEYEIYYVHCSLAANDSHRVMQSVPAGHVAFKSGGLAETTVLRFGPT